MSQNSLEKIETPFRQLGLNYRLNSIDFHIGDSDFENRIKRVGFFIDKSLLIKEVIDDGSQIKLITRPRRFGKTLNMSMLDYFFSNKKNGKDLFKHLKIWNEPHYRQFQGKYPVIFLTFKDVTGKKYDMFFEKLKVVIAKLYDEHKDNLLKNFSDKRDEIEFILNKRADPGKAYDVVIIQNSLENIINYLADIYKEQVVLLIDEYDTPIHYGYEYDYYAEMIDFMRDFLKPALKDNKKIYIGVLTGILRVSKESIFSGLNNVTIYSVLSKMFSPFFGFSEAEIKEVLSLINRGDLLPQLKEYYGAYQIGNHLLFNPWSLVNFLKNLSNNENLLFEPYWANTSDNKLAKIVLDKLPIQSRECILDLLKNQAIKKCVDENMVFPDIKNLQEESKIWGFLLYSGYLTAKSLPINTHSTEKELELFISNRELYSFYKVVAKEWFDISSLNFQNSHNIPIIWNVPPLDINFVNRPETDEITDILNQTGGHYFIKLALVGMGGIGKTQLAVNYAETYKNLYQIVWWFRRASLFEDYRLLALELNKKLNTQIDTEYENAKNISQEVIDTLRLTENWLLIFDDIEDEKSIYPYLPQQQTKSHGHIIITSRFQDWQQAKTVEVRTLSEEKGVSYLLMALKKNNVEELEAARELTHILGCLPLALAQAKAYIRQSSITIKQYVELYKNAPLSLQQQSELVNYPLNIVYSLRLSILSIKKIYSLAVDLLSYFIFLSSHEIAEHLLGKILKKIASDKTQSDFERIKKLWIDYSLITFDKDKKTFSIHVLLQNALESEIDKREQGIFLKNLIPVLIDDASFKETSALEIQRCSQLLPHLVNVLSALNKIPIDNGSEQKLRDTIIEIRERRGETNQKNNISLLSNAHLGANSIIQMGEVTIVSKSTEIIDSPLAVADQKEISYNQQRLSEWNLPNQLSYFCERPVLHEKIRGIFKDNEAYAVVDLISSSELCGTGKTQLANDYIHNPPQTYKFRAWFSADSLETLRYEYWLLAQRLGLIERNDTIEYVVERLKRWFASNTNWLLVYDNVRDYENIHPLLPLQGGHILITSPSQNSRVEHTVVVPTMSLSEAELLIKRLYEEEDEQLDGSLPEKLGCLPLAIVQAASYIKIQKITVKNYVRLYEESKSTLIGKGDLFSDDKYQSIAITWELDRQALINKNAWAVGILQYCSLLNYGKIPDYLLVTLLGAKSRNLFQEIKEDLLRYLLITLDEDNKYISIHPLLQEFIVKQMDKTTYCSRVCALAMKLWEASKEQSPSSTDIYRRWQLLPHIMKVLKAMDGLLAQQPDNKLLLKPNFLLLSSAAFIYLLLGDVRQQKVLLEKALAIQDRQHYVFEHVEMVSTLVNLASAYGTLGDVRQARALLEKALSIQEKHYGAEHVVVADTLIILAVAYTALGDIPKARALLEKALSIQKKHYGSEHVKMAVVLNNLANVYSVLGDVRQQKVLLEKALTIQKQYYGFEHVEMVNTLVNLANAYGALGNVQQQKALLEKVLSIQEKHYGAEHVIVVGTLIILAFAHGTLGDVHQQKVLLEKALSIQEKHYGAEHVVVVGTLINLAAAYGVLGNVNQQKALLEKVLSIQEKQHGAEHVAVVGTLINLAAVCAAVGDVKQQKALLEKALIIFERHYGKEHVQVAIILNNLANAHGNLGDTRQQKELLEKALAIKEQHYGKTHPETATTLYNLAVAYRQENNPDKAKTLVKQALTIVIDYPGYGEQHPYAQQMKAFSDAISQGIKLPSPNTPQPSALTLEDMVKKYNLPNTEQTSLERGLRSAVANQHLEDVKFFTQHVENINAQDTNPTSCKTALHYAVSKNNIACLKLLLDAGANPEIPDAQGLTTAQYAQQGSNAEIQQLIQGYLELITVTKFTSPLLLSRIPPATLAQKKRLKEARDLLDTHYCAADAKEDEDIKQHREDFLARLDALQGHLLDAAEEVALDEVLVQLRTVSCLRRKL